jgi:hypothetical protein
MEVVKVLSYIGTIPPLSPFKQIECAENGLAG